MSIDHWPPWDKDFPNQKPVGEEAQIEIPPEPSQTPDQNKKKNPHDITPEDDSPSDASPRNFI